MKMAEVKLDKKLITSDCEY